MYKLEKISPVPEDLKQLLEKLEKRTFYYIDQKPNLSFDLDIDMELTKKAVLSLEEVEMFLKYVVKQTRLYFKKNNYDIENDSLIYQCINACWFIIHRLQKYFSNFNVYQLHTSNVFNSQIGHCFIVTIISTVMGDKAYVIDPTFRQFCLLSYCNENRLYHYEPAVMPGYFIRNIEFIKKLLSDGYFEIDEDTAKIYGDSFVLATKSIEQKEIILNSPISGKQYIKSLMYGCSIR